MTRGDQIGRLPIEECRVLVIEDEYPLATDLTNELRAAGVKVIGPIQTLDDALEQIRTASFHVAIMDINLHGNPTYELADELLRKGIPFIFATGYSDAAIPARFRDVVRFEKPYNVKALVTEARRFCPVALEQVTV